MNAEYIFIIAGIMMFLGFGLALIHTSAGLANAAREKLARCTAKASGRIVRNEKSVTTRAVTSGRRKITAYHPVVRFTDDSGNMHEYTHMVGVNPPLYREGETVVVLYNPTHPRTFILPKDDASPILQKFLVIFGVMCFFVSLIFGIVGFYAL